MKLEPLTIEDAKTGSRAKILPGLGFNCYSFTAATANGPLEALWSSPELLGGSAKPSGSGIPLLFPFAGRIGGTSFRYEGKTYELVAGDGRGNAIHGFVINRPWRVTEHAADRIVGQFQASVDDAELLKRWPADFRITAEYRVSGNMLIGEYAIDNPDQKPLPFGFGTHSYFRLPLGGTSSEECLVTVPASTNWELQELLPTGKFDAPPLVASIARGMRAADMHMDNALGGLSFENHRCTTKVHDPESKHNLLQTFDDQFTACVVFNPPHREAVCMEPYTTLPDAFHLQELGVEPHLRVLQPGQSFKTRIDIQLA